MADFNPFPDYPVVGLKAEMRDIMRDTIVTAAIDGARKRVTQQAGQWLERKSHPATEIEPFISAVKGDYGTGKTHLLLDAAAQYQEKLLAAYPDLAIVRAACIESDPLDWFRRSLGPELLQARSYGEGSGQMQCSLVERVMLRLYAAAARPVAAKTQLTESAVELLHSNPETVRNLIKSGLLNISVVDDEMAKLLYTVCPGVSENVRSALAGTVWSESAIAALKWLAGETIESRDGALLRVSSGAMTVDEAADTLVAVAAIHRHLESPFMLIVDELEHFARYDRARGRSGDITWLKRLLERLAAFGPMIFVSGHWTGWPAQQSDFYDRFRELAPIELIKLGGDDVLKIVQARVPSATANTFGAEQAAAVASSTGGNLRRVLTLCSILFRETGGFATSWTAAQIEEAGRKLGQRIGIDECLPRLQAILESAGLTVRTQGKTQGEIPFDLIGERGGQLKAAARLVHAVHQTDLHGEATRFLEQMTDASKSAADIVGCFVADGNIDDEFLAILNRETRRFKIFLYDLTKPDALAKMEQELPAALAAAGGLSALSSDPLAQDLAVRKSEVESIAAQIEERLQSSNAAANAGQADELKAQRALIERQLTALNQQLGERESALRETFLQSMKDQLAALDARRAQELDALYKRLETEQRNAVSRRDEEVVRRQEDEANPKFHLTYSQLTQPVALSWRLYTALSGQTLTIVLGCVIAAIALVLLRSEFADLYLASHYGYDYTHGTLDKGTIFRDTNFIDVCVYGACLMLLSLPVMLVLRGVQQADRFVAFKARVLRDIYVRSEQVEDLILADRILHDSLDDGGLYHWRERAERRLDTELPKLVGFRP